MLMVPSISTGASLRFRAGSEIRPAAGHRARQAEPKARSLPARRERTKFLAPRPPGMP
uniref:Uncharacterized protein n=1 Tax=Streptomyces sp. FQ1 TaxID=319426 RepID=Q58IJ9_9ACTN|nr:unknown [Streptomyces sp. FQ1]